MLFHTIDFAVFLVVVLPLYFTFPRKFQNYLLLFASYFFYGYWDIKFLSLIAMSTVVDYYCGIFIYKHRNQKKLQKKYLYFSVFFNLGVLCFFKYFNFFIDNVEMGLAGLGVEKGFLDNLRLSIILPVGISFYTFQTMSYTIDIYRGQLRPTKRFFDFALFVSYFPQLVAGPIERAQRLLPQILKKRQVRVENFYQGGWLLLLGYFKKVFVADNCAVIANSFFENSSDLTGAEVMVAVLAFTFQIYGDFSGYTDIARGISKILGIELMVNFRVPYFSLNPSDFWRRWHISLSSWLRDYVYIPLGGSRKGRLRTYINLSTTMLLGGLWHGASWTFVVWGGYQGALLIVHRLISRRLFKSRSSWWVIVRISTMFILTNIGWLIFRSNSMNQLIKMLDALFFNFTWMPNTWDLLFQISYLVFPLTIIQYVKYQKNDLFAILSVHWFIKLNVILYLLYSFLFLGKYEQNEFIYFQF